MAGQNINLVGFSTAIHHKKMMIEIMTLTPRKKSVLERINEKEPVYVCHDEESALFGTASWHQAQRYARINGCYVSSYPVGCYCEEL